MMKLIVGLGNPGKKYAKTRHNLGFMVVEALAFHSLGPGNFQFSMRRKYNAETLEMKVCNQKIVLVKPQTMMNASGFAVARIADFYKIKPKDIWVVYDDVDLPLGKLRIRPAGTAAGHHGVESIIAQLGTDKFVRFRLGIGHPGQGADDLVEKYVLREFSINEKIKVEGMIKKTIEALKTALEK